MEDLETRLIQGNLVTKEQCNLAKEEALRLSKPIWVGLVRLGYLSLEDIVICLAQESGIAYVRPSDYRITDEVIRLVDENFCRRNLCLPLFKVKDTLFVACMNPLDTTVIDSLANLTGFNIEPLFASVYSITAGCDYYYGIEDRVVRVEKLLVKQGLLSQLPFWRDSKRMPLNIPVSLKLEDENVVLNYSSPLEGYTRDISLGGTAIGLQVFLFIPKGTSLFLEFRLSPGLSSSLVPSVKAKGEVVYCRMEKSQHYFLGIKFIEIEDSACNQLLKLATAVKK